MIVVEDETAGAGRSDVAGRCDRLAVAVRLRVATGKLAETFVATSGVLALLVIVIIMALMVRGIRLLHPR